MMGFDTAVFVTETGRRQRKQGHETDFSTNDSENKDIPQTSKNPI
jgi:hypothetical protein